MEGDIFPRARGTRTLRDVLSQNNTSLRAGASTLSRTARTFRNANSDAYLTRKAGSNRRRFEITGAHHEIRRVS